MASEWGLDHCLCRCTCFEGLDDTGGSQAWHTVNFTGVSELNPDSLTPPQAYWICLPWCGAWESVFFSKLCPQEEPLILFPQGSGSGITLPSAQRPLSKTSEEQFVSLSLVELEKSGQI